MLHLFFKKLKKRPAKCGAHGSVRSEGEVAVDKDRDFPAVVRVARDLEIGRAHHKVDVRDRVVQRSEERRVG